MSQATSEGNNQNETYSAPMQCIDRQRPSAFPGSPYRIRSWRNRSLPINRQPTADDDNFFFHIEAFCSKSINHATVNKTFKVNGRKWSLKDIFQEMNLSGHQKSRV